MSDAAEQPIRSQRVEAKIAWTGHDEIAPVLANQLAVRIDATNDGLPDTVTFIFGLAQPPLALDAEAVAALKDVQVVESRAVAKVAIGASRLREFANVLSSMADQVDERLRKEES